MDVSLHQCMCTTCVQEPPKARRMGWVPWSWSYKQTVELTNVRPEFRSSVRAVHALNSWATPPAPKLFLFLFILKSKHFTDWYKGHRRVEHQFLIMKPFIQSSKLTKGMTHCRFIITTTVRSPCYNIHLLSPRTQQKAHTSHHLMIYQQMKL